MEKKHQWMVHPLLELEQYARQNNLHEVGKFLTSARQVISGSLEHASRIMEEEFREIEKYWFEEIIDRLARYAHEHDLTSVEAHLLGARKEWDKLKTQEELSKQIEPRAH